MYLELQHKTQLNEAKKNHILFEFESFTVAPHAKLHLGLPFKLTLCEVQIVVEMQRWFEVAINEVFI